MSDWDFRENSLDLIRLVAATQVMVLHSFEFTMNEVTGNLFFELLRLFPGVPIFFFISGYLISRSYERSPTLLAYFKNRVLRIFPALLVCVFVNICLVASTGYFSENGVKLYEIGLLFLAKASFLQFYNPDFMRMFGDGVLNGSLWTICVELQFYFIVPIGYAILGLKKRLATGSLVLVIIFFIFVNQMYIGLMADYSQFLALKFFRISFAPWIYMFLFGVLVQRKFDFFASLVRKVPDYMSLPLYIIVAYVMSSLGVNFGNGISPFVFFILALLVFRFSYSNVIISKSLLKGNDVSYGIYIWHMVYINQLTYLYPNPTIAQTTFCMLLAIVTAILSWFLLERKFLALKSFSMLGSKE